MGEHSHIEDFFRKRLSSQEFVFQEEDWLKMERKLELSGLPANTAFVRSPVKLVIIIIAGLTAAFVLGWMTNELVRKNKTTEILKTDGSSEINPQSNYSQNDKPDPSFEQHSSKINRRSENQPMQSVNTLPENRRQSFTPKAVLINDSLELSPPVKFSDKMAPAGKVNTRSLPVIPDDSPWKINRLPSKKINLLIDDNDNLILLPVDVFPGYSSFLRKPLRRFSIGLAIAPDFNSTGLMHRKSMSPAIGGVITYAIFPRWSISARIFFNNKKYRSSAEYYNVSDYYWQNRTNGVVPDIIDASCRVIDVPLLINYTFLQKRILSFTASAGLGSYFLLDEKYSFTFNGDNPGAATEWETSENSQAYFNVVNLAMGLSLRTGSRTSMVMEPYMKIPLKQMGWAKVNLSGMGLIVSFNYQF